MASTKPRLYGRRVADPDLKQRGPVTPPTQFGPFAVPLRCTRVAILAAVAEMQSRHPDIEAILIESGGDNLSATFSPELADVTLYVIDVAAGEEIPRKGGPAITRSDVLIINKTDLAPHVGASLEVMERDAKRMRAGRPFVFTALRHGEGVADVIEHLRQISGLGLLQGA